MNSTFVKKVLFYYLQSLQQHTEVSDSIYYFGGPHTPIIHSINLGMTHLAR